MCFMFEMTIIVDLFLSHILASMIQTIKDFQEGVALLYILLQYPVLSQVAFLKSASKVSVMSLNGLNYVLCCVRVEICCCFGLWTLY